MIQKSLQRLEWQCIDLSDETYKISATDDTATLSASIQEIGVINPIIVQEKESGFRIVCGFRRAGVLQQLKPASIDAFVIKGPVLDIDMFMYAAQDNRTFRNLNPIEISRIVYRLEHQFNIPQNIIISDYFPRLGLGKNPKLYVLHRDLYLLSEAWQQSIISDHTPLDVANTILKHTGEEQDSLYHLFSTLRLGKNRQREFLLLLSDIARIQKYSLKQLVAQQELEKLIANPKLTPSQKSDRVKSWLLEQRYPHFVKAKEEFENVLRDSKCPPNLQIQAPPFFEGEDIRVFFSFNSEDDYKAKLLYLQKLYDSQTVQQLLSFL